MSDKAIWGPLTLTDTKVLTSGASYQMVNDGLVIVNKGSGSATAISLPKGVVHGQQVTIKDGKLDAATNNITVTDPNSKTIDGASSFVMNVNGMEVTFAWDGVSGTAQWRLVNATTTNPAGFQLEPVANGLTAHAGGGQGSATPLTAMINRVTTVGTAADSVVLPAATPGLTLTVVNAAAANSMNVFPASGDAINALSANAAFAVAAGKTAQFYCANSGQWHSILSA